MDNNPEPAPGFAPDDPVDGRKPGEWDTRYPDVARKKIHTEACYLAGCLVLAPVACWLVGHFGSNFAADHGSAAAPAGWQQFAFAWIGGMLGGTLFSIKWLYHSVARNIWNIDRRLWRLFTPHLSGAVAFAFVILTSTKLISIFDERAFQSVWTCFGLGFLVGYFSDSAMAKLNEVSHTLFGAGKATAQQETHGKSDANSKQ